MPYVRQCVDYDIKFAKIIYKKCSQLKKNSHNHLKSPAICSRLSVEFSFLVFVLSQLVTVNKHQKSVFFNKNCKYVRF
jgi:hypothetical protein